MTRVYILGAGAMGTLVAHELAHTHPALQTILLFKNQRRLDSFIANESLVQVTRYIHDNIITTKAQLLAGREPPVGADSQRLAAIENLIVSTKTYQTAQALQPYVQSLPKDSNVLLLQNGMGVLDEIKTLWPEGGLPNFYQAISTHGAYKTLPESVHHVGLGKLSIAKIGEESDGIPPFIQRMLEAPHLNAEYIPYTQLILVQMEKLVVNACINPLTAVFDCFNGDLLYGSHITRIFKNIILEATTVLKRDHRVLSTIPEANAFLDDKRLLQLVLDVCRLTAKNSLSMREDVRHLNPTEVEYINGYIVKLGRKHRIPTPTNNLMRMMVRNRLSMNRSLESLAIETALST